MNSVEGPRRRGRRRLVIGAVILGAILTAAYVGRGSLIRALIAVRIAQAQVLSPTGAPGLVAKARFYWDIAGLRQQRDARFRRYEPELKPLAKEISKRERAGRNVALSSEIYREVRWWVNFTTDRATTEQRIAELRASLASDADQSFAREQNPADGSWGAGYTVWFMKLYASVDEALSRRAVAKYPLRFLEPIATPEKLTAHMESLRRDDFTRTGIINRQELDETASAIARLMFGDVSQAYAWAPGTKGAFLRFLDDWQNPATGCWGVWFVGRDGTVWKQDDVGITFHLVSDCGDKVKHLDRIARRVLQLTDVEFPAGIRINGHYENHLNWDVVKIVRAAWPQLDEPTRRAARAEIAKMLHWCLTESYQPDGSFKTSDLDDTAADAMQYGFAFLRDTGFFAKEKRFWTDEDFPEAEAIHRRIEARRAAMGMD